MTRRNDKTEKISIRLSPAERALITLQAHAHRLPVSQYLVMCAASSGPDPAIQAAYAATLRAYQKNQAYAEHKKLRRELWYDKNAVNSIMGAAAFSLHHLGAINMKEINLLIDMTQRIYDSLEPHVQEIKKYSHSEILRMRDPAYLAEKMGHSQAQADRIMQNGISRIQRASHSNLQQHIEGHAQRNGGGSA